MRMPPRPIPTNVRIKLSASSMESLKTANSQGRPLREEDDAQYVHCWLPCCRKTVQGNQQMGSLEDVTQGKLHAARITRENLIPFREVAVARNQEVTSCVVRRVRPDGVGVAGHIL